MKPRTWSIGDLLRYLKSELVIDEVRDNYLWVKVGWSGKRRIDGRTFFARIRGGQSLIEEDWTARRHSY